MDWFTFLSELLKEQSNIKIEYSNFNGEEKLLINGKEVSNQEQLTKETATETFDDAEIKRIIKDYKNLIDDLDDCIFVDVIDEIREDIDIKELDKLLNQTSFTEIEAVVVKSNIDYINSIIKEKITAKMQELANVLEKL